MKRTLLVLSIIIFSVVAHSQSTKNKENKNNEAVSDIKSVSDTSLIFTIVEEMPLFPGGEKARSRFLADSIIYPETARKNGIQGTVYVSFIIDDDGSVTNVKILRGIGGGCDEEALRVVRIMPKWIPGKQDGKAVRVLFNMPINFKLRR
jgi:periplasmic protein TonB